MHLIKKKIGYEGDIVWDSNKPVGPARRKIDINKAKKEIITLRGSISASHNSWAGVLYDGKKMFKSKDYQITHIVDRVGAGDSFMGGLIYGILNILFLEKMII